MSKQTEVNTANEQAQAFCDAAIDMLELEELWEQECITEAQLSYIEGLEMSHK